ncbi:MAG TPA: chorismate mutase [Stellaceae bacterium]|nr:chorismate mutase [Stellaceae bacterium]
MPTPATMPQPEPAELQQRLDRIDDRLHTLLIARTELARQIDAAGGAPRQPNREAEKLRRLFARHRGMLPFAVVVSIWRELVGIAAQLAEPGAIAIYHAEEQAGLWDVARTQYGCHAPMFGCRAAAPVIQAVADRKAVFGVLPLPQESEPEPWWPLIASRDPGVPRVVARLPLAGAGNARPGNDAFVIALAAAESAPPDCTLLAVEFDADTSRARVVNAIAAVGFDGGRILAVEMGEHASLALVEIDGDVAEDDPRRGELAAQLGQGRDVIRRLGGYATPLATPANNLATPIRAAS